MAERHTLAWAALHASFLAVLKGDRPTRHDDPLTHALAGLRQRMQRQTTPSQLRFLIQTARDCFASVVWETANRTSGVAPDVATFIHQRQYVSGVYTMLAFIMSAPATNQPR